MFADCLHKIDNVINLEPNFYNNFKTDTMFIQNLIRIRNIHNSITFFYHRLLREQNVQVLTNLLKPINSGHKQIRRFGNDVKISAGSWFHSLDTEWKRDLGCPGFL